MREGAFDFPDTADLLSVGDVGLDHLGGIDHAVERGLVDESELEGRRLEREVPPRASCAVSLRRSGSAGAAARRDGFTDVSR
jgi:hypothetical protein